MVEIRWSIEALRVHLIMNKEAEEPMQIESLKASFLREPAMRCFLFFCRESYSPHNISQYQPIGGRSRFSLPYWQKVKTSHASVPCI
ncbi:Major intracellular serine protease [Fusarium oxysporum f. sp. albedinis]|nr:Major intracellular serine protease [Fusarium oxysporum f. sp. albedinis]